MNLYILKTTETHWIKSIYDPSREVWVLNKELHRKDKPARTFGDSGEEE